MSRSSYRPGPFDGFLAKTRLDLNSACDIILDRQCYPAPAVRRAVQLARHLSARRIFQRTVQRLFPVPVQ